MAYKTKSSPLNQFGSFGRLGNSAGQQSQNVFTGGLSGAMRNTASQIATQAGQQMQSGLGTMTNNVSSLVPKVKSTAITPVQPKPIAPATMQPSPINPKAVGNPNTVKGVYGQANENTFTRTVQNNEAPMMQLANPGILQDGPQLPPQAVQTSVTPTLGFEND